MQIEILAKDIKINKTIRTLIEDKLVPKIDKLLPHLPDDEKMATIRIMKDSRWGYKVSFSMILPKKKKIYSEEKSDTLQKAIVILREEVIGQIKEYKEKLRGYE